MKGIVTMKMLIVHLGMLLFFITTSVNATNVNGRFLITGVENSRISVLLQINTNTGTDYMGGTTIVVGFDNTLLNFPDNPQLNTNYIYHNFSGGNYSPATITKPSPNMLWLNIDLPYNNSNNGTLVSGTNGWTDVATIHFNLFNGADSVNIKWLTSSPYWGIYNACNTILWNTGNFTNLETKINNDNTAPVLLNTNLTDPTTLELIFSEPLESTSALNKLNYVINNGISVLNVTLSSNNTQATIKTTTHTAGSSYNILIQNVFDPAGNIISTTNNPAEYYCELPPALTNLTEIIVNNTQTLTLKFSNKMDAASVINKNNYSSSSSINIITVQLLPDTMGVVLKTSKHSDDTQYTLTIVNVKDRTGNYIAPNPGSHIYRTPKKGKGNAKRDIEIANSPSWFQDLTPDKTIDGQGMTTSTSRWQSGTSMPSDIDYDLGEGFTLDSLRTSFYKWEAGRMYLYSVYISNDSLDWVPAVEEVWSENTEWTELKFEPVETRYLRLVIIQSNQGNTPSLWEVEAFGGDNVTNVTETNENSIPENFALLQNYPNPFNPSTRISWQSPVDSRQTLKIYDILGNEIATLVDEYRAAGTYEVSFDASGLTSGVYIYRIMMEGYSETKKMVLLR